MNKISYNPDFSLENQHKGRIAGVDEAGRGPMAGPVVAAAVVLDQKNFPNGLNDSKKLSEHRRDILYEHLFACAQIGIGMAEPEEIERINVLAATMVAMERAVLNLAVRPDLVLVDGNRQPNLAINTKTIIKGDQKSLSIAAASIIAKVTRDRIMKYADIRFPGYGFAAHKGYPTVAHRHALSKIGPCPIHRYSYAPVKAVLTSPNKVLKR